MLRMRSCKFFFFYDKYILLSSQSTQIFDYLTVYFLEKSTQACNFSKNIRKNFLLWISVWYYLMNASVQEGFNESLIHFPIQMKKKQYSKELYKIILQSRLRWLSLLKANPISIFFSTVRQMYKITQFFRNVIFLLHLSVLHSN